MYEAIPDVLKEDGRFCVWKYEERDGKTTKVPYTPGSGCHAKPNDPTTFRKWDDALTHVGDYDGIGILIYPGSGLAGIDIDHCITDGAFSDVATDIIQKMHCYTEKSPSGTGIRILFQVSDDFHIAEGYYTKNSSLGLECYAPAEGKNRYLTLTGNCLYGTGILEPRDKEFQTILDKYMKKSTDEKKTAPRTVEISLDDEALLKKAREASNGSDFIRLYDRGDTSGHNNDDSSSDQALCNMLCFWCGGDKDRIDRLFRRSALMRDKWDSKRGSSTYGKITIAKAIQGCREYYNPIPRGLTQNPDFLKLWNPTEEPTEEGDAELCKMLSPHCGNDKNRIDGLFRQSGRMREKWKDDAYRSLTLDKAISVKKEEPVKHIQVFSGEELRAAKYEPTEFLIDGLLPAGTQGILTAPQKTGKSWLCLDIVLSRAMGRPVLGHSVKEGNTLYLSLEDGTRRLSRRINTLLDENEQLPPGANFITEFYRMDDKHFYDEMMFQIEATKSDLVIVDVFQLIRGSSGKRNEDAYQKDYRELSALKRIFSKAGVALLIIHHPNKGNHTEDPHNSVSGSVAMTAVMDYAWTIQKDRNQDTAYMNITGRDVIEQQLVITFDKSSCRWKNHGDADSVAQMMLEAKYNNSPIVKTVRLLVQENGKWTGNGEQLRREATKRGLYISEEHQALTREIASFDGMFYERDGIIHQREQHGKSGSRHIFKTTGFEEVGDEQQTPWDEQMYM